MLAQAPATTIDFAKRFIPEHITPLFHTESYAVLTAEQRLRYNQLHALYFNEQTIFFESAMARHILADFLKGNLGAGLKRGLQKFIAEEAEHSAMFRELNRKCAPAVYGQNDFYFVRVPAVAGTLLQFVVKHARWFPFLLWVLLIQEERAYFYAQQFLSESAGLEPNFVATQRRHLADEVGHIGWDEELLDLVWPEVPLRWRNINAQMFTAMMREYFTTPKRSAMRVIDRFIEDFPELKTRQSRMHYELLQLGRNSAFNSLCYSREVTPKAFARFDRWPEFCRVSKALVAYRL